MSATMVFAVPAYNGARHVREAIESMLAQGPEARVVVVDDASDDGSYDLLLALAGHEPRLTVVRNDRRLGMPRNWQRAAEEALARHPEATWFAWGSDHDVWRDGWLEGLTASLLAALGAALAYPTTVNIDDEGASVARRSRPGKPGDAIYGLFRVEVLRACLPVPVVPAFDRVVLARARARGAAVHLPSALWLRRYAVVDGVPVKPRVERQLPGFWPDGGTPWWTALPVHWVHGAVLARDVMRDRRRRAVGAMTAADVVRYLGHWTRWTWRRRRDRLLRPLVQRRRAMRARRR